MPYSLSYATCDNLGGDGNSNFSCPAHPLQECQVRLPEKFDSSNTFEVSLERNGLGLGFSICGGLHDGDDDRTAPTGSGLVRVKKIFPLQPAWLDGRLRCGDILVRASGVGLVGLPVSQALDVLRAGPLQTILLVHRPCAWHQELDNARLCQTVARSRSFTPATRHGLSLNLSAPLSMSFHAQDDHEVIEDEDEEVEGEKVEEKGRGPKYGEFTVELRKVKGSLGFSLSRGEEESTALRHGVKALLREPALTDGRIRPGDKLISANGISCDAFTHQELVAFLRGCPDRVILVLYRDSGRGMTPASPTDDADADEEQQKISPKLRRPSSFAKEQAGVNTARHKKLRHEAKEMVRSLQASRSSLDGTGSPSGGSVASSGGGTLFRRGLSPHRAVRARALSGGDGPAVQLSVFDPGSPVVEFPASPTEEGEYRSLPAFLQQRLQIEELTASVALMEEDEHQQQQQQQQQDVRRTQV